MTVVAALVSGSGAWIAGDTMSSGGGVAVDSDTPKVGRYGDLLLGYAGTWRVGQQVFEIAASLDRPTLKGILAALKPKTMKDWYVLVVERLNIYEVDEDMAVVKTAKRRGVAYNAIGTGAHCALGALYVAHDGPDDLLRACAAAAKHTTDVRQPFYFASL